MQESYEELIRAKPWVQWQVMGNDLKKHLKPNTPEEIKKMYEDNRPKWSGRRK